MKRFFLILLLFSQTFCISVSANQDIEATVVYNLVQGEITVVGSGLADAVISLIIISSASRLDEISDIAPPKDARVFISDSDGKFSESLKLSNDMLSGKYTIYLASNTSETTVEFMYVNEGQAAAVLPQINSAASATALASVISANATALGIDPAIISTYLNRISVLLNAWNRTFAAAHEFSTSFNEALACLYINDGFVSQTLLRYSADLGLDYEQDYNKLSDKEKSKLDALLTSTNYSVSPIKESYPKLSILAKVQAADRWSALQTIILGNSVAIGADISSSSRYASVQNKDAVFERMFLSSCTKFENILENFNSAVEFVLENEKKTIPNGNGAISLGGGGGGGGIEIALGRDVLDAVAPENIGKAVKDFPDTQNSWAREQIAELVERKIINGFPDGTFGPDLSITRAEFSKMLVLAFSMALSDGDSFLDVSSDDWFAPYVYSAYKENIVKGYDNLFAPHDNITRQDAAVMIHRYLSNKNIAPIGEKNFNDSLYISDYAQDAVSALASAKLLNGDNNLFNPHNNTTRAEASTIIYNILKYEELSKN